MTDAPQVFNFNVPGFRADATLDVSTFEGIGSPPICDRIDRYLNLQKEGLLSDEYFPCYRDWILGLLRKCADRTGKNFAYRIDEELWSLTPGNPPQKLN